MFEYTIIIQIMKIYLNIKFNVSILKIVIVIHFLDIKLKRI